MTDVVGVLAAVLTTSAWVPQVERTLRKGTASDFSWSYLALYGVGLLAWLGYGLGRDDAVIVVSNALPLGGIAALATVKLRSKRFRFGKMELVVPAGTHPATALQSLGVIGPQLAADLRAVGIADPESLRAVGVEDANRRLVDAGLQTGVHSRQAIDAALQGRGSLEGAWGSASVHRHRRWHWPRH